MQPPNSLHPFDPRETHSDEGFDDALDNDETFPFDGYDLVLETVVREAGAYMGQHVLDLSTGGGALAQRFADRGCTVWVLDFSTRMVDAARYEAPSVTVVQADIWGAWPPALQRRFDSIVSSYTLHEFDLATKIKLIQRLAIQHLAPEGRIVIGDIAFRSDSARAEGRRRWAQRWDESEYYMAADEAIDALESVDLDARYTQISSCGGVLVIEPL